MDLNILLPGPLLFFGLMYLLAEVLVMKVTMNTIQSLEEKAEKLFKDATSFPVNISRQNGNQSRPSSQV
jgi:hypothetical protein